MKREKELFDIKDTKIIKGIAIILMFYHHLFAFPERLQEGVTYVATFNIASSNIAYYIGVFGKICVALFLFLSGYGLWLSAKKWDKSTWSEFTYQRLKKVMCIYWKVFFVMVPISILLDVNLIKIGDGEFINNLLAINISYNGEWWFLTPYLMLILIFPLIKNFLERSNEFFLEVLGVVILNVIAYNLLPQVMAQSIIISFSNTVFVSNCMKTMVCAPAFMMGCVFAKYDILSIVKNRYSNSWIYTVFSVVLLGVIFWFRYVTGMSNYNDYIYAPLLICCVTIIFSNNVFDNVKRLLEKIGEESTIMWLTHSFFCYLWCQKIVFMPKYSVFIVIWLLFITYCTSGIIKKIYMILQKLFNNIMQKKFLYSITI